MAGRGAGGAMAGFLSRERIVARPGFNRWLVPPAALAIHLCIGQAYAISVFNLPLGRAIGITVPSPSDWKLTTLGWIYTLAIDRKSTRLNSSHSQISYAVFCLKKKR